MENSMSKSRRKSKSSGEPKPEISMKEFKRQKSLVIISAIYVIYGIIFYYLPLVGWIMAFQNFKFNLGITGSKFVGLDKFKFLFRSEEFLRVIRNTFCMGLLNLVFSTVFAIVFAILLNEVRHTWFKKSIQTISYLPHFLSWIIVTSIVHDSLTSTGIFNDLLMRFGFVDSPINFLAIPKLFWPIVTIANLWKETGWNAIIYLAAITSIDPSLYESASIDGAGRFQKMWYITLPSLRPTILILLLMNVGNVLNAGFELQYLLGNGLVQDVSKTIDIYVLDWAMSGKNLDYSLGTAAGIFKTVVSISLILIFNKIAKSKGEERLF